MIRTLSGFGLWSLALLGSGCGSAESDQGAAIRVAVSVTPQVWLVEQIGGERVTAFELVRAGESPATYQPTDRQVTRLLRSEVYFRIGVPFERSPWFDAIRSSGRVKIVDLRQGVELRRMARHDDAMSRDDASHSHPPRDASGEDPHIWLSPRNLAIQGRTVAQALAEIDPDHAAGYHANLLALESRLEDLDRDLRQMLGPLVGKSFFVFHPAWGYFADQYGLREVAIEIEGKEPSDRELTRLHQQALAEGARVIFVQPQISGRTAQAVASAIGGRLETLDPLAYDVTENLLRVGKALRGAFE